MLSCIVLFLRVLKMYAARDRWHVIVLAVIEERLFAFLTCHYCVRIWCDQIFSRIGLLVALK